MNKEYAIYPFKYMRITQRHDEGNHKPHWYNVTNHSDKPWDEACQDGGRSYFEPKNDFIIEEIIGIDTSDTKKYTNAVRLKSVNKLTCPYGEDYLYVTLTHMDESNLKQVKKGQILKAGSKVLLEGTDGDAKGNHFHVTANFGKYYGLLRNNNDKWCFTYEKSLLPNEAFYLDKSYTDVKNARNYDFKEVPKEEMSKIGTPVARDKNMNQIEVLATNLRLREAPSTSAKMLGYINKGIYNFSESKQADNYTWYNVGVGWIAFSNSWCTVYEKEEQPEEIVPPSTENESHNDESNKDDEINQEEHKDENKDDSEDKEEVLSILQKIVDFIKKIIDLIRK